MQAAADEGALRADIPPDLISRLLFGMVNSLVEWYRPDGTVDPDVLAAVGRRTWRSRGWAPGVEPWVWLSGWLGLRFHHGMQTQPAHPTMSTSWEARVHRGRLPERSDMS